VISDARYLSWLLRKGNSFGELLGGAFEYIWMTELGFKVREAEPSLKN